MYNDIIGLVKKDETTNSYGDTLTDLTTTRNVFCRVMSIGQSEFYQAQTAGMKPEIKFVLPDYYDYNNETELIYNNVKYKVLRTYRKGNELEITCYGGVRNVSA